MELAKTNPNARASVSKQSLNFSPLIAALNSRLQFQNTDDGLRIPYLLTGISNGRERGAPGLPGCRPSVSPIRLDRTKWRLGLLCRWMKNVWKTTGGIWKRLSIPRGPKSSEPRKLALAISGRPEIHTTLAEALPADWTIVDAGEPSRTYGGLRATWRTPNSALRLITEGRQRPSPGERALPHLQEIFMRSTWSMSPLPGMPSGTLPPIRLVTRGFRPSVPCWICGKLMTDRPRAEGRQPTCRECTRQHGAGICTGCGGPMRNRQQDGGISRSQAVPGLPAGAAEETA